MATPKKLGNTSKPAVAQIGGSSGTRTTAPVRTSSPAPASTPSRSSPAPAQIGGSSGIRTTTPVPVRSSVPSVPVQSTSKTGTPSTPPKSNYSPAVVPSVPSTKSSSTLNSAGQQVSSVPKTTTSKSSAHVSPSVSGSPSTPPKTTQSVSSPSVPSATVVMKTATLKNYKEDVLINSKSGEIITTRASDGSYTQYKNVDDKVIEYREYDRHGGIISQTSFPVPLKASASPVSVTYTSQLVSVPSVSQGGNISSSVPTAVQKMSAPTYNKVYEQSLFQKPVLSVPTPGQVQTKIERLNQGLGDWAYVPGFNVPATPKLSDVKSNPKLVVQSVPSYEPGSGEEGEEDDDSWIKKGKDYLGELYQEYAPTPLKSAVQTVSDAVTGGDEEQQTPPGSPPSEPPASPPPDDTSSLTPPPLDTEPVLPPKEEKKGPIEKELETDADTPVEFTYDDDDQYLETDEEIRGYVYEWLNSNKDRYGLDDSDVEVLTKYFYPLIPSMSQNDVDFAQLANAAHEYESIIIGIGNNVEDSDVHHVRILQFEKNCIDNDVPAVTLGMFNVGIATKFKDTPGGTEVYQWMSGDGYPEDKYTMQENLNNDFAWRALSGAGDFLESPAGMATLGGGIFLAGAVGTFMVGGPMVALAGMGTTPFAVTEFIQTFGPNAFKTKQNLQLAGNYARDHSSQWDDFYRTAKGAVDNVSMMKDTNNGNFNNKRIQDAEDAVAQADENFKNEAFFLLATGEYQSEMDKLKILHDNLDNAKTQFDDNGAYIARDKPPRKLIAKNIPPGVVVEWNGIKSDGDEYDYPEVTGAVISSVIATLPDGTKVPLSNSLTISPYDPEDKEMDIGAMIEAKQLSNYKKSGASDKSTTYTVVIPKGSTAQIGNEKVVAGDYDVYRQFTLSGAESASVTVSKPGQKAQTRTLYATDDPEAKVTFALATDPYSKASKPVTAFVLNTDPSTVVTIDGKPFQRTATANKVSVSTPGYHHVKVVAADGSTWEKDVYVSEGAELSIPDPVAEEPKEEYQQYGGGGGGGGGYSGGGGGGGGSYSQPEPEPTQGLIIYGATCEGADIWQDEVQVYPVIGETYGIEPGHHSVKIVRQGKKPWLKTVYISAGDTLTVSPAFEDVEPTEQEPGTEPSTFPKRVFVNSDPSGARVLLNGGATGQWTPCFFDLPKGLYTFTIQKSGYEDYDIICWVGSVIAWNDQALSLSELEGAV